MANLYNRVVCVRRTHVLRIQYTGLFNRFQIKFQYNLTNKKKENNY